MSTPKRKLFAGADDSEDESAIIASSAAKKASPKKAAKEDNEINKPSSARRVSDSQKMEDTAWIRENYNVKTLLYFLEQCADILHKYNPILTGSSAILVYLITGYQAGNIERPEFESMLKSLKPINDLDAVFEGMVIPADFAKAGFTPQLKYAKKLPDILTEADGIPFVKDSVPLEPKSGDSVDKPIKIEVIIAKTVGKQREADIPEIIERAIELPKGKKINVRIYHPRSLLREYKKMDNEDGKRDDKAKITVLRQLIDTGLVTPAKPSSRPSRFAGVSVRKLGL
jgi:hypothetical protein